MYIYSNTNNISIMYIAHCVCIYIQLYGLCEVFNYELIWNAYHSCNKETIITSMLYKNYMLLLLECELLIG